MNSLVELFNQYNEILEESQLEFDKRCVKYERKKGDFFLRAGQVVFPLFVLEKGAVRAFVERDDKEINTLFLAENEVITLYRAFFLGLLAKEIFSF